MGCIRTPGFTECNILPDFNMKHHFDKFIATFKIKIRNFLNTVQAV